MKKVLLLSVLVINMISLNSFADTPVSSACQPWVYYRVNKSLPKNEFVSNMSVGSATPGLIDLEITQEHPDENYCMTSGTAQLKDEGNGVCDVTNIEIDRDSFDCG